MPYFAKDLRDVYEAGTGGVTNVDTVENEIRQSVKMVDCGVSGVKS